MSGGLGAWVLRKGGKGGMSVWERGIIGAEVR